MAEVQARNTEARRVRIANAIRAYLPILLIMLGGTVTYVMYSTGRIAMAIPVVGVLLGGVVSWATIRRLGRKELLSTFEPTQHHTLSFVTRPRVALSITALYLAVTIVLYLNSLYERPSIAYPLHGVMFGYLALFIVYRNNKIVTVVQLVPVAFVTYWSAQLAFPSGTGRTVREARHPEAIFEYGGIVPGMTYESTPGYYILSGTFSQATGLSWLDGHLFVAVLIVASPILVLASLDRVFPSITPRIAQLSALLFATTAYTLNRGITPHRTSFFYIHTVLIGYILFFLLFQRYEWRYLMVGLIVMLGALVGHTFSAGAPLVILLFAVPLGLVYLLIFREQAGRQPLRHVSGFIVIYGVLFFGYEISVRGAAQVFRRGISMFLSLHSMLGLGGERTPSGGGGTVGGRYSELSVDLLVQATLGEVLLFTLAFGGIAVLAFSDRFDLDMLVLWIGAGFLVLFVAVFIEQSIPAQRFYQVSSIFGLTIAAATGLSALYRASPERVQLGVVVLAVCVFATFSIVSPIAGSTMTPLGNELPSAPLYDTAYHESNADWNDKYIEEGNPAFHEMPFERIDPVTATINTSALEEGQIYKFDYHYAESGTLIDAASSLGGASVVFVEWNPAVERDNQVYSNGGVKTFKHN